MLLRNYGELKDLYSRYRSLLPLEGEDAYALSLVEFWAMASDFDILTPVCSVARLNRMVFSGIRNHREVAPDDMQETKPLTPRSAELNLPRRHSLDSHSSDEREKAGLGSRPHTQESTHGGGQRSEISEEEESISSSVLPSPGGPGGNRPNSRQGATKQTRIPDPPASARSEASSAPGQVAPNALPAAVSDAPPEPTVRPQSRDQAAELQKDDEFVNVTHFRRPDGDRCRKTHDMSRPLLQRQFLEAIVRISLARFPHERGLESQINRLFKELVNASLDKPPRLEGPFEGIAEPNLRRALNYFEPVLSKLFGAHCDSTFRQPDASGGAGIVSTGAQADVSDSANGNEVALPANLTSGMRRFGDYCPPNRRFNVRARLDVTVRVKDVVKLFDSAGLICATPSSALGEADNAFGCALPLPPGETLDLDGMNPALVQTLQPGALTCPLPSRASATTLTVPDTSFLQSSTPAGTSAGTPATTQATGVFTGPGNSGDVRRSSTDGNNVTTPDGAVPPPAPPDPNTRATKEDFAQQDVRCNIEELLRIVTGVLSPASVANIQMQLDPDDCTPNVEHVTLLEYLETELIYAEFERILVCLADRSLPLEKRESLVPARVLEGFLQFVFLPALSCPYAPPKPVDASPTLEPQESETGAANPEAAATAEAAAEDASGDAAAAAGEEQPAEAAEEATSENFLDLWHGFDGGSHWARAEANQAPRTWVGGYELTVSDW